MILSAFSTREMSWIDCSLLPGGRDGWKGQPHYEGERPAADPCDLQVPEHQLTHQQAAEALGLTARHIRRLRDRLRGEGDQGLVYRGRGRSHRTDGGLPRSNDRSSRFTRSTMAIWDRRSPWSSWRRIMASSSVMRRCGVGYARRESTSSPAAGVPIGPDAPIARTEAS